MTTLRITGFEFTVCVWVTKLVIVRSPVTKFVRLSSLVRVNVFVTLTQFVSVWVVIVGAFVVMSMNSRSNPFGVVSQPVIITKDVRRLSRATAIMLLYFINYCFF